MNVKKDRFSFIAPELATIAIISKWEMISTAFAVLILGLSFVISYKTGRTASDLIIIFAFVLSPLVIFYIHQKIIRLSEDGFLGVLKWLAGQLTVYVLIVSGLLIFLFSGVIQETMMVVSVILLALIILGSMGLSVNALLKAKSATILWNKPLPKRFWDKIRLENLIHLNVYSIVKHFLFFLIFFCHITILSVWLAKGIQLKADLIALLPEELPSVRGLKEVQEIFGGFGYLMLAVETNESDRERKEMTDRGIQFEDKYEQLTNGQMKFYPRINKDGIVQGMDERAIRSTYYITESDGENGSRIKKKVEWEAKLYHTKLFMDILVKGGEKGLQEFREQIETKIKNLLKQEDKERELKNLNQWLERIKSLEEEGSVRKLKGLEDLEEVSYCDYKKNLDVLKDSSILYASIGDLALIYARARKKKGDVLKNTMGLGLGLEEAEGINFDDILDQYQEDQDSTRYLSEEGYYLSGNNKMMVGLVKPSKGSLDIEFCKTIYRKVRQEVEKTRSLLMASIKNYPVIKIGYGGRYKRKPDGTKVVEKDIELTSFLGLLFIVGIVVLYFGRFQALLLIGFPLIMGIIWTFGASYLRFGYVNVLTGFLSVILMGLGVDFGIHFLSRYYEERKKGKTLEEALYLMLTRTGKASLTAVFTTIASFLALVFTNFKGFSEFGFIGVIGLIMSYLAMFYVLPAFLIVLDKLKSLLTQGLTILQDPRVLKGANLLLTILVGLNIYLIYDYQETAHISSIIKVPFYYLVLPYLVILKGFIFLIHRVRSFSTGFSISRFFFKKPGFVLLIMIVLGLSSLIAGSQVYFEYNFRKLEGMSLDSFKIEDKISDQFDLSLTPSVVIANNKPEEKEIFKAFKEIKKRKGKKSTIDIVDALSNYVPEHQTEKLQLKDALEILVKEFNDQVEEEGFKETEDSKETKKQFNEMSEKYLSNAKYIYEGNVPDEVARNFKNIKNTVDKRTFIQLFPIRKLGDDGQKIKAFAKEIRGVQLKSKWVKLEEYSERSDISISTIQSKIDKNDIEYENENWLLSQNGRWISPKQYSEDNRISRLVLRKRVLNSQIPFKDKGLKFYIFVEDQWIVEEEYREQENLSVKEFKHKIDTNAVRYKKESDKRLILLEDPWKKKELLTMGGYMNQLAKESFQQLIYQKKAKSIQYKKVKDNHFIYVEGREVSASGENLVLADILFLVEKDAPFIVLSVLILTILIVYIDFRSLGKLLVVLIPLFAGLIFLFGFMYVFDVQFNILNVVIFPVIIGIGIDSGVHIYHRYQDEGRGNLLSALKTTGMAVTFASLTTMLGFGALIFANHKGLNSIGWLAVLGIGASFLLAITLLPTIILLWEQSDSNEGASRFSLAGIKERLKLMGNKKAQ